MINFYKYTDDLYNSLNKVENIQKDCWIDLVSPSEEELNFISKETGVPLKFFEYSLDEEETSRIDIEENIILIIIDIPFTEMEENSLTYDTYPLGIIHTENFIITICLKNSKIISDLLKMQSLDNLKKSSFILYIINNVNKYYNNYLRQISRKSSSIERSLYKSIKNKELVQLYSLEKSLVYFSTSLKANELTLEKIFKLEMIKIFNEDKELLEDVLIEHKQTIEMVTMYSSIISNTMKFFSSIISNNLNIVMKRLSAITILLSIPTIISGIFGMNVLLPFTKEDPRGFPVVMLIIIISCTLIVSVLHKKDIF